MKDCGDYRVAIRLYLDRELGGPSIVELRAHLQRCPACRQELEAEEELSGLLRRTRPLYSTPESLRERVQQLTAEARPERSLDIPPKQGR
jgi:mycothiol system anti-sigma-R factor